MNLVSMKNEDGELLLKLADNLETVGVKMRDANGNLLSTFDILKQLSTKWSSIDQDMQMSLLEDIAGKRQANILSAIIQNWGEVEQTYTDAINSQGSAMEELGKYQEGLQYKVDVLKETLFSLYRTFIDSDFLSGVLSGFTTFISILDSVVGKFGTLNTVVFTVSTTMLMFNDKFRGVAESITKTIMPTETLEKALKSVGTSATTSATSAGIAKTGFMGLNMSTITLTASTIALQAAMSLGLSLAITALVSGITTLIGKMNDGSKATREYQEALDSVGEVQSIEELVKKLEDKNISDKDSLEIRKQIAALNPELISGYDSEGNAISGNVKELKEYIKLKYEEMAVKALAKKEELEKEKSKEEEQNQYLRDSIEKQKKYRENATNKDAYDESIASLNERLKESESALQDYDGQIAQVESSIVKYVAQCQNMGETQEQITNNLLSMGVSEEAASKAIEESTRKLQENTSAKQENLTATDALSKIKVSQSDRVGVYTYELDEAGRQEIINGMQLSEEDRTIVLEANAEEVYQKLNEIAIAAGEIDDNITTTSLENLQLALQDIGLKTKDVDKYMKSFSDSLDETGDSVEALKKSWGDVFVDAIDNADKLYSMQEKINKSGEIDSDIMKTIVSDYPELIGKMNNRQALQEEINNMIRQENEVQQQAYLEMMQWDDNWYQTKIANNQAVQNSINEYCAQFVDAQGNSYSIDLKNYRNLAEMKTALTNGLAAPLGQFIANLIGGNAEAYTKDLSKILLRISVMVYRKLL